MKAEPIDSVEPKRTREFLHNHGIVSGQLGAQGIPVASIRLARPAVAIEFMACAVRALRYRRGFGSEVVRFSLPKQSDVLMVLGTINDKRWLRCSSRSTIRWPNPDG